MPRRPILGARRGAARAIPALAVVACALLAAAAYAASRPSVRLAPAVQPPSAKLPPEPALPLAPTGEPQHGPERGGARLGRPRIAVHPEAVATATNARFAFSANGATGFQCRLDGSAWTSCRSPRSYATIGVGEHSFSVRGVARRAPRNRWRRGPAASFSWRVVEPKRFSIQSQVDTLAPLYPGAPAQTLPVTVANPNEVAIYVTSIGVRATGGPEGCDGAANLELLPAGVSAAAPLPIPPGGSVSLPAPGFSAPSIAMRDLPSAQDACEGGNFSLDFGGEAHG